MAEFIAALASVTIDDDNDAIVIDEGGALFTGTITHGTYYPRGDGSADDLLLAVAAALDGASSGGNGYGVTLTTNGTIPSVCIAAASPTATVRVARTSGSTSFRVRWNHSGTTFDPALLGFAVEKAAADANAETSTLSPSCIWAHNDRHIDLMPDSSWAKDEEEMASGDVEIARRSGTAYGKVLRLELVDGRRMWAHRITSDRARAWESFVLAHGDGRPLELHELDLQAGSSTLLGAPSTSTRVEVYTATTWKIAGESGERIGAKRVETGMDHWDIDVMFRAIIGEADDAADPPPGSPVIWLDGDDIDGADNETLDAGVSAISSWANKGSLGGSFSQATSTAQPTYFESGLLKGAQFAGLAGGGASADNDFLDFVLASPLAQPFTACMIVSGDNTSESYAMLRTQTSGGSSTGQPILLRGGSGWSSSLNTTLNDSPSAPSGVGLFDCAIIDANGASSNLTVNAVTDTGNVGTASAINRVRLGADIRTDLTDGRFALRGKVLQVVIWHGASRPSNAQILAWATARFGSFPV